MSKERAIQAFKLIEPLVSKKFELGAAYDCCRRLWESSDVQEALSEDSRLDFAVARLDGPKPPSQEWESVASFIARVGLAIDGPLWDREATELKSQLGVGENVDLLSNWLAIALRCGKLHGNHLTSNHRWHVGLHSAQINFSQMNVSCCKSRAVLQAIRDEKLDSFANFASQELMAKELTGEVEVRDLTKKMVGVLEGLRKACISLYAACDSREFAPRSSALPVPDLSPLTPVRFEWLLQLSTGGSGFVYEGAVLELQLRIDHSILNLNPAFRTLRFMQNEPGCYDRNKWMDAAGLIWADWEFLQGKLAPPPDSIVPFLHSLATAELQLNGPFNKYNPIERSSDVKPFQRTSTENSSGVQNNQISAARMQEILVESFKIVHGLEERNTTLNLEDARHIYAQLSRQECPVTWLWADLGVGFASLGLLVHNQFSFTDAVKIQHSNVVNKLREDAPGSVFAWLDPPTLSMAFLKLTLSCAYLQGKICTKGITWVLMPGGPSYHIERIAIDTLLIELVFQAAVRRKEVHFYPPPITYTLGILQPMADMLESSESSLLANQPVVVAAAQKLKAAKCDMTIIGCIASAWSIDHDRLLFVKELIDDNAVPSQDLLSCAIVAWRTAFLNRFLDPAVSHDVSSLRTRVTELAYVPLANQQRRYSLKEHFAFDLTSPGRFQRLFKAAPPQSYGPILQTTPEREELNALIGGSHLTRVFDIFNIVEKNHFQVAQALYQSWNHYDRESYNTLTWTQGHWLRRVSAALATNGHLDENLPVTILDYALHGEALSVQQRWAHPIQRILKALRGRSLPLTEDDGESVKEQLDVEGLSKQERDYFASMIELCSSPKLANLAYKQH